MKKTSLASIALLHISLWAEPRPYTCITPHTFLGRTRVAGRDTVPFFCEFYVIYSSVLSEPPAISLTEWAAEEVAPFPHHIWRGNRGAAPALPPSRVGGCLATPPVPYCVSGHPLPRCMPAVTAESILTLQNIRVQRILSLPKRFGDTSWHSEIP